MKLHIRHDEGEENTDVRLAPKKWKVVVCEEGEIVAFQSSEEYDTDPQYQMLTFKSCMEPG